MIVIDRGTVHEIKAALKERFWPRFFLFAFCAIVSIGSMLPFIYLEDDFAIRLLFSLVWMIYILGHLLLTLVINTWSAPWHSARKLVLYGTHNARGFCKCPLFVFRFATPFLLYILLWIPSILQCFESSAVDTDVVATRNWTVFAVFFALVALFFGAQVCGSICKFKPRKEVVDLVVVINE